MIFGEPNVGKSSLLNRLLGFERAIVSDIAGTTRDTIEETINLHGIPLRLVDTAGVREAADRIEAEGIQRTVRQIEAADLLLEIADASRPQPGRRGAARLRRATSARAQQDRSRRTPVVGGRRRPCACPASRGEGFDLLARHHPRLAAFRRGRLGRTRRGHQRPPPGQPGARPHAPWPPRWSCWTIPRATRNSPPSTCARRSTPSAKSPAGWTPRIC